MMLAYVFLSESMLKTLISAMITSRRMRQDLALHFAMPLTVALLLLGGNAFADTYTIDATGVDWSRGESIWMNENGNTVKHILPVLLTLP